jgi:hypothetical protein
MSCCNFVPHISASQLSLKVKLSGCVLLQLGERNALCELSHITVKANLVVSFCYVAIVAGTFVHDSPFSLAMHGAAFVLN